MAEPKVGKAQVLEMIRAERGAWDDLLGRVPQDQMTMVGVTEGWSLKDHIAHLTMWEERPVAWLEAAVTDSAIKPAPWPSGMDTDATNAWIKNANSARSVSDLLRQSESVHKRVVELVESMAEQDLLLPDRVGGLEGSNLLEAIAGDTYEHYHEHAESVRAWLESRGRQP